MTIDFLKEVVANDEYEDMSEAQLLKLAEDFNCEIIHATPSTLLVDLDDGRPYNERVYAILQGKYDAHVVDTYLSRNSEGRHYIFKLDEDLPLETRLLLQVALGSDPLKEVLSLIRNGNRCCLLKPRRAE